MKDFTKMFLNLVIVGSVSGALLAGAYYYAEPLIQANRERELKESIFLVLPEAKDYKTIVKSVGEDEEDLVVYVGLGADARPVGIAFEAEGGGFQGNISIMVGLGLDYMRLKGIKVLEQVETPGLGNRIGEARFQNQFKGLEITPRVEYVKNKKPERHNQIQAISGATISSDAVVRMINNYLTTVLKEFPKEEIQGIQPLQGVESLQGAAPKQEDREAEASVHKKH